MQPWTYWNWAWATRVQKKRLTMCFHAHVFHSPLFQSLLLCSMFLLEESALCQLTPLEACKGFTERKSKPTCTSPLGCSPWTLQSHAWEVRQLSCVFCDFAAQVQSMFTDGSLQAENDLRATGKCSGSLQVLKNLTHLFSEKQKYIFKEWFNFTAI